MKKRENKLKFWCADFYRISAVLLAMLGVSSSDAAQQSNPRSAVNAHIAAQRVNSVARGGADDGQVVSNSGRGVARATVARSGGVAGRGVSVARSATGNNVRAASANTSRGATIARSVVNGARMGTNVSDSGLARAAARARATAVFTDISKIGGGYAACREAYATCMDQFCANANDTYRRCYCSPKFTEFRDTENAIDEAKTLLMRFEDNNLNAVDKTAAEVDAMYSVTVGEAAIKKDTSGAQSILNDIADLLAGKQKVKTFDNQTLGLMSVDFSGELDDIWVGGSSSIFDTGTGVDLTTLEGQDLFNASNKQCVQLIAEQCENSATLNMATSAYGIMITQDCNTYEKKLNSKRESVLQTVRQAEKILREARLEEYRAHNSADVNECISKVKNAITSDAACGAGYKRCLDYTGKYVSATTGEVAYDTSLFKLTEQITLTGGMDVLGDNPDYNKYLDDKKMFAKSALDTCRDIADIVWTEFKRSAMIEIAQAQENLIEETKMSCVSTITECYDVQSNALKDFDETTAKTAGALSVYAARYVCQDRVARCAALYDGAQCKFDSETGKLTSRCGLTALLEFVDTVDSTRVAEGCITAIDNYVVELCTPSTGTMGFPWKCRSKNIGSVADGASPAATASLWANVKDFAVENCTNPTEEERSYDALPLQIRTRIERKVENVVEQLDYQLYEMCESLDGVWMEERTDGGNLLTAFYSAVFGGQTDVVSSGVCLENTARTQCLSYNEPDSDAVATYDAARGECVFTGEWYQSRCALLGGSYSGGLCYVGKELITSLGGGVSVEGNSNSNRGNPGNRTNGGNSGGGASGGGNSGGGGIGGGGNGYAGDTGVGVGGLGNDWLPGATNKQN